MNRNIVIKEQNLADLLVEMAEEEIDVVDDNADLPNVGMLKEHSTSYVRA